MSRSSTCDVLTFNINNPSRERAERQLAYLAARPEQVLVLTETADSAGCAFLMERFTAAGYSVGFPRPPQGERGVMIVSRLATSRMSPLVDYLPHRAVEVTVATERGPLDIRGVYVPSRDASPAKVERKRAFLEGLAVALSKGPVRDRLLIGDFNILEPDHVPQYRTFRTWEYDFYRGLGEIGYEDAFRALHPHALEYSWVGKTGDGYRYDHAHASGPLGDTLRGCSYIHEPRTATGTDRLTDHSALSVQFTLAVVDPLPVTDPMRVEEPAPALF